MLFINCLFKDEIKTVCNGNRVGCVFAFEFDFKSFFIQKTENYINRTQF